MPSDLRLSQNWDAVSKRDEDEHLSTWTPHSETASFSFFVQNLRPRAGPWLPMFNLLDLPADDPFPWGGSLFRVQLVLVNCVWMSTFKFARQPV